MERQWFRNGFVTIGFLAAAVVLFPPETLADQPVSPTASSQKGVVAADHGVASDVGAELLARGGNAVDAAVGTLLALGVVNPFASGLGGGGFCLVRTTTGDVSVIDFRERAPLNSTPDMYIVDGKADISLTMAGGLAVAVPGEARGLEALHQKYGKLPWGDVVKPSRLLAERGFVVGELLPKRLAAKADALNAHPKLAAAFQRNGQWVEAGAKLKRPGLARALALLEQKGAAPFYTGDIASEIVGTVKSSGGIIVAEDLAGYQVTWRDPLRGTYRGYEVFTMPPPSSGGTTILETLNILERYDLGTLGHNPESVHRITEALKHAFANRAQWLGDADFVEVPTEQLVSKEAASRHEIDPGGVLPSGSYGTAAPPPDDSGTSHVSIVDDANNMVACTSTINTSFGSLVYVDKYGLVLNNEMGDFTAQPGVPNNYGLVGTSQNAVAPSKRPLSSMSPTLVVHDDKPFMAVGASGGPTIITGTLLAMIRVIDWKWDPAAAIAAPRIHHQWLPEKLFVERMPQSWIDTLSRRGHAVEVRSAYNSVQMVLRLSDGNLVGVSDPRKMGRPAAVAP